MPHQERLRTAAGSSSPSFKPAQSTLRHHDSTWTRATRMVDFTDADTAARTTASRCTSPICVASSGQPSSKPVAAWATASPIERISTRTALTVPPDPAVNQGPRGHSRGPLSGVVYPPMRRSGASQATLGEHSCTSNSEQPRRLTPMPVLGRLGPQESTLPATAGRVRPAVTSADTQCSNYMHGQHRTFTTNMTHQDRTQAMSGPTPIAAAGDEAAS